MKFLSDRMTHASGKIGGTVFAHNRGGLYARAWRKPVNPRTAQQNNVRNNFSTIQAAFPLLSSADQESWQVMAQNMVFPSVLGTTEKYTAFNCFQMCNLARLQAGQPIVEPAPTIYEMASLTPPTVTITAAGTTVSVAYDNSDAWATEDDGALLVYASRPQNSTKIFFIGPYRFAGKVLGNTMTPPTSPATITLPFVTGPTGSKQFFRFVSLRADGRVSTPFRVTGVV